MCNVFYHGSSEASVIPAVEQSQQLPAGAVGSGARWQQLPAPHISKGGNKLIKDIADTCTLQD